MVFSLIFLLLFFVVCTALPFQLPGRGETNTFAIGSISKAGTKPFAVFVILRFPFVGSFVVLGLCTHRPVHSYTKEISEDDDDDNYCFGMHIAHTHTRASANKLPNALDSPLH